MRSASWKADISAMTGKHGQKKLGLRAQLTYTFGVEHRAWTKKELSGWEGSYLRASDR